MIVNTGSGYVQVYYVCFDKSSVSLIYLFSAILGEHSHTIVATKQKSQEVPYTINIHVLLYVQYKIGCLKAYVCVPK